MSSDISIASASELDGSNGKSLHVLFFSDSFRPYISGVVTSMDIYAQELRGLGHRVTIVAPEYPGAVEEPDVIRLPSMPLPGYPKLRLTNPVTKATMTRLLDLQPDVVHTHSPFAAARVGLTVARTIGCPVVFTCHSFYEEYARYLPPFKQPLKQVMRKYLINYCGECDLVIAPSQHLRDFLIEIGIDKPVVILPTGVHPKHFDAETSDGDSLAAATTTHGTSGRQGKAPFTLAMVGRLAKEKTPELALETIFELAHQDAADRDRWRLIVIGDGPEGQKLRTMAVELGIKSLVTFTGEVSRREVFAFLGLVDGIIFTSAIDTQGLAVLEGMAMRLPVVTAESPAARELVRDGQEGLVCPADPVALANAVRTLANDPALADRMGQAALERSRAFHPTLLAVRLAAIYAGLCRQARQAGRTFAHPDDNETGRDQV